MRAQTERRRVFFYAALTRKGEPAMLVAPENSDCIGISCLAIDGAAHDHDMLRKAKPVFCANNNHDKAEKKEGVDSNMKKSEKKIVMSNA
jgi:hypothetical protein